MSQYDKRKEKDSNLKGFTDFKKALAQGFVIKATFTISTEFLDKLRYEEIPEEVLSKLQALQGRQYSTEQQFTAALEDIFDETGFKEYTQKILRHAVVEKEVTMITNPEMLGCSQTLAESLYETTRSSRQKSDTVNQFRKVFNEIRGLNNIVGSPAKIGVELRMLQARIGYAAGRNNISQAFKMVIDNCIEKMLELNDFKVQLSGFCEFFEALYAYYHFYYTTARGR